MRCEKKRSDKIRQEKEKKRDEIRKGKMRCDKKDQIRKDKTKCEKIDQMRSDKKKKRREKRETDVGTTDKLRFEKSCRCESRAAFVLVELTVAFAVFVSRVFVLE